MSGTPYALRIDQGNHQKSIHRGATLIEHNGNALEQPINRGRVFAYCHDSVGIGHLARTLAICGRIGREFPFSTSLLATGTPYVSVFEQQPHVDFIKLPALTKVNAHSYESKFLSLPTDELMHCREALLRQAVEQFNPDIVLVDKAPTGVCGEFLPALDYLRKHHPKTRIVFGMRDIEDAPETTIAQWSDAKIVGALETIYDEIWVYGDRNVFDVTSKYQLSDAVATKTRYMGYIAPTPCDHSPLDAARPNLLVTVGGGTDGEYLLQTYLDEAAGRLAKRGICSTLVGGPDMPPSVASRLSRHTATIDGAEWIDVARCLSCRIKHTQAVVSMGGYNTLCQIVRHRKSSLIVPRIHPRVEQTMRARLWADRGLINTVDPTNLTSGRLADAIDELLSSDGRDFSGATGSIDLNGLDRVTERFGTFWQVEGSHATALPL